MPQPSRRDLLLVFGLAVGLRLLFAALLADTYDPDEFVVLALGRAFAHGAVPYRDFMFFHPPGILVLVRLLDPLTTVWWPLGRLLEILVDSGTAVLVWYVASFLYGRREALAAGVLYATSPIVLLASGRILQTPLVTALGMAGIALLLTRRSFAAAALAGVCLAAAVWVKYPALLFLPSYGLLARGRVVPCLLGFAAGVGALFAPFLMTTPTFWTQTVEWQLLHRLPNDPVLRLWNVVLFWLLVNPLTVAALIKHRARVPVWVLAGFATGALFLLAPQTFYHYFVPMVPFAALLGAPVLAPILRLSRRVVLMTILGLAVVGAGDIASRGLGRHLAEAARFSGVGKTVQLVERDTRPGDRILADRFEYAYLAGRPSVDYFWNMRQMVAARDLTRRFGSVRMVILTRSLGVPTYPVGVESYLDARYPRYETPVALIWMTSLPRRLSYPTSRQVDGSGGNEERAKSRKYQSESTE